MDDIVAINKCLKKKPPYGVQIATHANKDCDAINCAIFEDLCKTNAPMDGSVLNEAVVILMDELQMIQNNNTMTKIRSNAVKILLFML